MEGGLGGMTGRCKVEITVEGVCNSFVEVVINQSSKSVFCWGEGSGCKVTLVESKGAAWHFRTTRDQPIHGGPRHVTVVSVDCAALGPSVSANTRGDTTALGVEQKDGQRGLGDGIRPSQ